MAVEYRKTYVWVLNKVHVDFQDFSGEESRYKFG